MSFNRRCPPSLNRNRVVRVLNLVSLGIDLRRQHWSLDVSK
jgi:hypothetical protein